MNQGKNYYCFLIVFIYYFTLVIDVAFISEYVLLVPGGS
jgi:hypothetical protein